MRRLLSALFVLLSFSTDLTAQESPISIVSGHPDFKIKILSCKAMGNMVYLNMQFLNEGDEDVNQEIILSHGWSDVYDSEGNGYSITMWPKPLAVKSGNGDYNISAQYSLITSVPIRVTLRIEGVPTQAEFLARIRLFVICSAWGLNSQQTKVQIRNVPITR